MTFTQEPWLVRASVFFERLSGIFPNGKDEIGGGGGACVST